MKALLLEFIDETLRLDEALEKTRETYVAYRKAGYSKKFLAEHENEISVHKAAKQYFDQLGSQKLPTVKTLQAEYSQLLARKKSDYAQYRQAREEMKELLTVKKNLKQILGCEEAQHERDESSRPEDKRSR